MTTHEQTNNETRVAVREQSGQVATVSPTAAVDAFVLLDQYAGGVSTEAPRIESLATISAGKREFSGPDDKFGKPTRSKTGEIYLHDKMDRAPGLRAALAQRKLKALTIAFPFNDPSAFIKVRFTEYTSSELKAFGDQTHLMVLGQGGYRRVEAGTDEYARAVARCKVAASVYFCLAEWGATGPEIVFPDGVGAYYRLRFTSRHSLRSILAGLREMMKFTKNGMIAGIPFELSIDFREVAGPDGKKRTIPVWVIVPKPPEAFRLTSGNFQSVMNQALEQGALMMMMPALPEPTLEEALAEAPDIDLDDQVIEGSVVEPSDDDLGRMRAGGGCDVEHHRKFWFRLVDGSALDEDAGRAEFFRAYTAKLRPALRTESLGTFLVRATEREAWAMQDATQAAAEADKRRRREAGQTVTRKPAAKLEAGFDPLPGDDAPPPDEKPVRSYEEVFGVEDDMPEPSVQPSSPETVVVDAEAGPVASEAVQADDGQIVLPEAPEAGVNYGVETLRRFYTAWATTLRRLDSQAECPIALDAVDFASKAELIGSLKVVMPLAMGLHDAMYGAELEDSF